MIIKPHDQLEPFGLDSVLVNQEPQRQTSLMVVMISDIRLKKKLRLSSNRADKAHNDKY